MSDDLVTWLRAQLDDDEREAKRVEPDQAPRDLRSMVTRDGSAPFLVIDSARLLAEVDAKRRILDEYERYAAERRRAMNGWESSREVSPILTALALPYSGRPGYRPEWATSASA